MNRFMTLGRSVLPVLTGLACGIASAALPQPTATQQQAAARQAQAAAAETEKAKQELDASMQQVADRWRARAAQNGWAVYTATAPTQPKGTSTAPATPVNTADKTPMRSEKRGTAPSSADVKDPSKKGL